MSHQTGAFHKLLGPAADKSCASISCTWSLETINLSSNVAYVCAATDDVGSVGTVRFLCDHVHHIRTVPFESLRMSHVTKGAFVFVKWPCVTRLKGLIGQGLVSQTQKGATFDKKRLKFEFFSPICQFYLISGLFLVVPWLEYSSKLYFNSNIIRILYECHCHWPHIRSFGKVQICRMSQAIRSDSNGTVVSRLFVATFVTITSSSPFPLLDLVIRFQRESDVVSWFLDHFFSSDWDLLSNVQDMGIWGHEHTSLLVKFPLWWSFSCLTSLKMLRTSVLMSLIWIWMLRFCKPYCTVSPFLHF